MELVSKAVREKRAREGMTPMRATEKGRATMPDPTAVTVRLRTPVVSGIGAECGESIRIDGVVSPDSIVSFD